MEYGWFSSRDPGDQVWDPEPQVPREVDQIEPSSGFEILNAITCAGYLRAMHTSNDRNLLHPSMRTCVRALEAKLTAESIPLRLYEGWRSPDRQAELYLQGRVPGHGTPGVHVTQSMPWIGRHQYGLAGDFVFWVNGGWTWVEPEHGMWDEYDKLARSVGLVSVPFERPHVQLAGVRLSDLLTGKYPEDGDASWRDNLVASIQAWSPKPVAGFTWRAAPPLPVPPAPHVDDLAAPGRAWAVPEGMYYDEERGMCLIQSAPDQTLVPQG